MTSKFNIQPNDSIYNSKVMKIRKDSKNKMVNSWRAQMLKQRNQQLSLFDFSKNIYIGTELEFLHSNDIDVKENITDINKYIEKQNDNLDEKHIKIILTYMVKQMPESFEAAQIQLMYTYSYIWVMAKKAVSSMYDDVQYLGLKFLNLLALKEGFEGKFTGMIMKFKLFPEILQIMTSVTSQSVYRESLWVIAFVLKQMPHYAKRLFENKVAMEKTFNCFDSLTPENINQNNSFFYFISKLLFNFKNCKIQVNPQIQIELYKRVIQSIPIISIINTNILLKREWLQCILQFSNNPDTQDRVVQDNLDNLIIQILKSSEDYCITMQCLTILRNIFQQCSNFVKMKVFPTCKEIQGYLKILAPNFQGTNFSPTDFRVFLQLMDSIVVMTKQEDSKQQLKFNEQQQFHLCNGGDQLNKQYMTIDECKVFQTTGFQLRLCKFIMQHPSVQIRDKGFKLLFKHLDRIPKTQQYYLILQNKIFHIPKYYFNKQESEMYYNSLLVIRELNKFRNQLPQSCYKIDELMVEQQYIDILEYCQDSKDLKVSELAYQIKTDIQGY